MADTEQPQPSQELRQIPQEQLPSDVDDRARDEASAIAQGTYHEIERSRHRAETQTVREANLDLRVNRKLRWK